MYDYPPILKGNATQDLMALRDYLVRKERGREQDILDVTVKEVQGALATKDSSLRKAVEAISGLDRQTAAALKTLIIKTADVVEHNMDEIRTVLREYYEAHSEYGSYYESIERQIEETAARTVDSYHFEDRIEGLENYTTELNGQICRGIIEDPQTHEIGMGIAISQELLFTGSTTVDGGYTYYELSKGQTLGMYTSTGWQFWVNGAKVGWFDSGDSMLHVSQILVESRLQHGTNWLVTTTGGYGIRYIGT